MSQVERSSYHWAGGIARRIVHIRERRRVLRDTFDVRQQFSAIEESCIPSYCHANWLAAYAAWWRLFTAAELARLHARHGRALDFEAGPGELHHLVGNNYRYDAVEADAPLARTLKLLVPEARLTGFDDIEAGVYDIVFALDSLEHNDEPEPLIERLLYALRPGGVLVLSGPTENLLYRMGRAVAGFRGGYHRTTIGHLNTLVERRLSLIQLVQGPWRLPLFLVSAWRAREPRDMSS